MRTGVCQPRAHRIRSRPSSRDRPVRRNRDLERTRCARRWRSGCGAGGAVGVACTRLPDDAHVLHRGRVALSGPAAELRPDRAVIEDDPG